MLNVQRFPFQYIKKQPKKSEQIKCVYLVQQVFMKLSFSHKNSVIDYNYKESNAWTKNLH